MDAERFGRALGVGVRETAKAVVRAVDAASSPNPRAGSVRAVQVTPDRSAGRRAGSVAAGVKRGGRRFGEAVWKPAARAGGVLWFELTGVFFGLFAMAAGVEVWRHRMEFGGRGGGRVWVALGMLLLFGWFTVTSFMKARERGRR